MSYVNSTSGTKSECLPPVLVGAVVDPGADSWEDVVVVGASFVAVGIGAGGGASDEGCT